MIQIKCIKKGSELLLKVSKGKKFTITPDITKHWDRIEVSEVENKD